MTSEQILIRHFRHFSERLALRYKILITFEQYVELCSMDIEVIEKRTEPDTRRQTLLGYIYINDEKVKVTKALWLKEKCLTTALPITHKFNLKPKS